MRVPSCVIVCFIGEGVLTFWQIMAFLMLYIFFIKKLWGGGGGTIFDLSCV